MEKEKIFEILGKEKGPTSIILAGTHGDEVCGVQIFEKILPLLKIEKGRVLFGFGNPLAIEKGERFVEANLNRMFKEKSLLSEKEKSSYEYRRAQFLKKYLDQADALLDVHASFVAESEAFIICERHSLKIANYLPFDTVLSGLDELQPGGTDYYMNKIGGFGICVECGFLGDPFSAQRAEKSIFSFLIARGHIGGVLDPCAKSRILKAYKLYFTKTNKFRLAKPFKDFETIAAGRVIGADGEEEIRAQKDSIILFARDRNQSNDEAFLLAENLVAG
jgi:succinylglutamate desuccinylase